MRVGRLPGRHHAARPSALVHGDHLDGIQIIRCEAELAAEEAKGAPDHVPAHADFRILAERYHHAPRLEQRSERLAHRGAGLDGHGAPFRVVVHALHGRDIEDYPHLGIRYESLEAVPATRHGETPSFPNCLLDRRHHLIGRADQTDVVRTRAEPLIETLFDDREIPRIVGPDSDGLDWRVAECRHLGLRITLQLRVRRPHLDVRACAISTRPAEQLSP